MFCATLDISSADTDVPAVFPPPLRTEVNHHSAILFNSY